MKKRGIAWPTLVYGIIGVMVVLSAAAIFTGPLVKRNPVLANFFGFQLPEYYDPEQGITFNEFKVAERITVANSMKALACSINSVASEKLDKGICDEEYQLSEGYIRQLEFSSNDANAAAERIAKEIVDCMAAYIPSSEDVKILPCFQLKMGETQLGSQDIKSAVSSEIKKLRDSEDESTKNAARQISRSAIWQDWLIRDRFYWDVTSKTLNDGIYTCIKDNYHVYITERPDSVCGIKTNHKECKGDNLMTYGSSCVKCDQKSRLTFNLDQDKEKALKQLAEATVQCKGTFEYNSKKNIHCSIVNLPPLFSWQITEDEYLAVLSKHGKLGNDLSGDGWINQKDIWWHLNDITNQDEHFFICARGGILKNDVILTKNPQQDCPVDTEKDITHTFSCNVKAFELPQEVSDAENYILGLGDPKYLVYYEQFPRGEEATWQFDTKTWASTVLGIRLAFVFFPIVKNIVTKARNVNKAVKLAESLDGLSGKAKEEAIQQINKLIGNSEKSIRSFLKASTQSQEFIAEAITKNIADDMAAKLVAGESAEAIAAAFEAGLKNADAGALAPIYKKRALSILTEQTDELTKISKLNGIIYDKAQDDIAKLVATGSTKTLQYAATAVKNTGFENFISIIFKEGTKPKEINAMLGKNFAALKSLEKTTPGLAQTLFTAGKDTAKRISDTGLVLVNKGAPCAFYGTLAAGAAVATVESFGLASTVAAPVLAGAVYKGITPCAIAVQKTWFPMLMGLGFLMSKQDSKERKFIPIGTNKIGVVQPEAYITDPAIFHTNNANNYYLTMTKDEGQQASRLFFASPCKTDIKITKNYCSCTMKNRDFYYQFTDNKGIVRKQPISIPQERSATIDYGFPNWRMIDEKSKLLFLAGYGGSTADTVSKERMFLDTGLKYPKHSFFYSDSGLALLDVVLSSSSSFYSEFLKNILSTKEIFVLVMESFRDKEIMGADQVERDNPNNYEKYIEEQQFLTIKQDVITLSDSEYSEFLEELTKYISKENERRENLIELCKYGEYALYDCLKPGTRESFVFTFSDSKEVMIPGNAMLIFLDGFQQKFIPQTGRASDISNAQGPYYMSSPLVISFFNTENFKNRDNVICHVNGYAYNSGFFFTSSREIECPWKVVNGEKVFDYKMYSKQQSENSDVTAGLVLETQSKIFYNSNFFESLMVNHSFKIFNYTGDKENIVKVCTDIGIYPIPPHPEDFKDGFRHETVPCISAEPQNQQHYTDEKWNDGVNYCYSGDNPTLRNVAYWTNVASIATGIALIPFTGGASASWVVIGMGALDAGAAVLDYALEACQTWPNHAASLPGCFK